MFLWKTGSYILSNSVDIGSFDSYGSWLCGPIPKFNFTCFLIGLPQKIVIKLGALNRNSVDLPFGLVIKVT
jgi:hypothetical protein